MARFDRAGRGGTRLGLIVVLRWIGGLNVVKYEAAASVFCDLLLCFQRWLPQFAAVGGLRVSVMSLVTLSFLTATPATRLRPDSGFLYLSGAGRSVIKDAVMIWAALVTMADSARTHLCRREADGAR